MGISIDIFHPQDWTLGFNAQTGETEEGAVFNEITFGILLLSITITVFN